MINLTHNAISTSSDHNSSNDQEIANISHCFRCEGLLAKEFCFDLQDGTGENWFWALRCVQCGEVLDPIIVQNRHAQHPNSHKKRSRRRAPIAASNFHLLDT